MQQPGIDNDERQMLGDQRTGATGEFRMNDAIELGSALGVAEGFFGQRPAIDLAFARQDIVAESCGEVALHTRRFEQFVPQLVDVDDDRAQGAKLTCEGALAGAGFAGDSNHHALVGRHGKGGIGRS